jgi:hypothetical protein
MKIYLNLGCQSKLNRTSVITRTCRDWKNSIARIEHHESLPKASEALSSKELSMKARRRDPFRLGQGVKVLLVLVLLVKKVVSLL